MLNDLLKDPNRNKVEKNFHKNYRKAGPDDCWEWTACVEKAGYGIGSYQTKPHRAHRIAYVLSKGPIPDTYRGGRACVMHKCDNRKCVNPAHLQLGNDLLNAKDMTNKRRVQEGEQHYAAVLTEEKVRAIRASKKSTRSLGEEYGVSQGTISAIKLGQTWKHTT